MEVCGPLSLRCCRFLSPCKTVGLMAALPQVSCGGFLSAAPRGLGSVQVLSHTLFPTKNGPMDLAGLIGLKDPDTLINQMVH